MFLMVKIILHIILLLKNPLNVYGLSKSLAEDIVAKLLFETNQAIILRTSWLIGPYGNNFLKNVILPSK